MTDQTVVRLHERETSSRRVVLVARVTEAIPAGASVGLVDVHGQLFLQVIVDDDADLMNAKQLAAATDQGRRGTE